MGLGKLRNRTCFCGSKKKYKKCCWGKDYKEAYYRKPQTGEIIRAI